MSLSTVLLSLVGGHYYTVNVSLSTPTAANLLPVWNALLDARSSIMIVQDCGRASDPACLRGAVPSNCKHDDHTLKAPYLSLGLSGCSVMEGDLNVSTSNGPSPLITGLTVVASNFSSLNLSQPGSASRGPTASLSGVEGVLGLSALATNFANSFNFMQTPDGTSQGGHPATEAAVMASMLSQGPEAARVQQPLGHASLSSSAGPSMLALDLRGPSSPSTLAINGYDPSAITGQLQWSQTQILSSEAPALGFLVFGMSVCGVPILGTVSSNWLAVPDTLTPCLGLPALAFNSLRAWALGGSKPLCRADASGQYLCLVDPGVQLPPLSLALTHAAPPFQLPLQSLLLDPDADGRRPLCIVRGANITGALYELADNPVVLGTLALQSLYLVADLINNRVGLALKPSTPSFPGGSCPPALRCVGQESYDRTLNACLPPACGDYVFQELDPDTNTCRFRGSFKAAMAFLAALAVAAELWSHFWRTHAGAKHIHTRAQRAQTRRVGGRWYNRAVDDVTHFVSGTLRRRPLAGRR